ncbi:unnamed protein product [Diamesa hyperborea]
MGLCKCPKKIVSNLFCFEHRVTVCEHCLVVSHRKCVIQSYLQWLKDSDFDSTCTLCRINFEDEDCIRLVCYHLFHWRCLNERQSSLPSNTAPSGHGCPTCNTCLFPPQNLVSPVADALRIKLGNVHWGRNELNLPVYSDDQDFPQNSLAQESTIVNGSVNYKTNSTVHAAGYGHHRNIAENKAFRPESPHSILNIESRPLLREPPIGSNSADRDDNKYKRKTPQEIFSRWSRRLYSPAAKPPWKRTWVVVVMGITVFCSILYVMYYFGRVSEDEDENERSKNIVHYDE